LGDGSGSPWQVRRFEGPRRPQADGARECRRTPWIGSGANLCCQAWL